MHQYMDSDSESALPDTSLCILPIRYMVLLVLCGKIAVCLASFPVSLDFILAMLGLSNTYIPIGDSSFSPSLFFIEEEGV